jgi:subtilisin family serine protease
VKHNNPKPEADDYNGVAHKAKITVYDVENRETKKMHVPSMYHYTLPSSYEAGARVSSNSWGTPGLTSYTSVALEVDEFMYENKDFLVVVAAGNAGNTGIDSVMSPGISKNALTIGASAANHNNIVDFSGIGKQFDGRIKPDVIGPGTDLFAAGVGNVDDKRSCNKQISSGTSMATPIIAGASILVREYFEQPNNWASICNKAYNSCPSPAAAALKSPHHRELKKKQKEKKDKKQKEKGNDGGEDDVYDPPEGFISGALLKGALAHSAVDMKLVLSQWNSLLPTLNLTDSVPPDRFQVRLSSLHTEYLL